VSFYRLLSSVADAHLQTFRGHDQGQRTKLQTHAIRHATLMAPLPVEQRPKKRLLATTLLVPGSSDKIGRGREVQLYGTTLGGQSLD